MTKRITKKEIKDTMFKMRMNNKKKQKIKEWVATHGETENVKNMSEFFDLAINVILEGRFFDE